MKEEIKQKIIDSRLAGKSYSTIAKALMLSENTIKSVCRRNISAATKKEVILFCKTCGASLQIGLPGKPKKFCSESCRRDWWKMHDKQIARKAFYNINCEFCHKEFSSYGNNQRKFCSHECYINKKLERSCDKNDEGTI